MRCTMKLYSLLLMTVLGAGTALAQSAPQPLPAAKSASAPQRLVVLFDPGSSTLRAKDKAVLDQASRVFNEGKPLVMIVTGASDGVGSPQANLVLSERRARIVLAGLLDRGLPADRFQVLAKGETEPFVPAKKGTAEPQNRRVEISWH